MSDLTGIRKAWKQHRGCVDWARRRSYALDIPVCSANSERVVLTAEDVGYRHTDGTVWEWWNIIYNGHIIDAERFESRYERFASQNVF